MYHERICPENSTQYVVKKGDTLWQLAKTYSVSVQSIKDANPGINADNLQVGSVICIPAAGTQPQAESAQITVCTEGSVSYTVKPGDTFWKLSQTYGVSLQSLVDANPGVPINNLQVGSTICIPTAEKKKPAPPPTTPITCPEGSISYTIKPGDTFWKLSQTYGVSLQSIVDANPGVPADNLQIGSTICIPAARAKEPVPAPSPQIYPAKTVTCPEGTFAYTVKPGDTFWKLSRIYGVSLQSLVDANPGVPANNLQIGSTICIPAARAKEPVPTPSPQIYPAKTVTCPEGSISYTVKPGDTFWKLSQIYGVSVQSIMDENPGVSANNLQVGSTICIPVAQPPAETLPEEVRPEEVLPEEVQPEPVPKPKCPKTKPRACPKGTFPYTVEAGDTLWQLALNFGVSVQRIIDLNPGINLSNLQVGSTICIPIAEEKPETAPAVEDQFIYIVKECDTICSIARKFYVSADSIIAKNPGINPRCLQPGTSLYIPLNCCASNTFRYVVSAGDNLYKIANKFNVCPASIIAANPNVDFNNLVRCQVICIPSR